MTKTFNIASIPGDGIGPEVTAEGFKILQTIEKLDPSLRFQSKEFPWGCEFYSRHGKMMDDDGIEQLKPFDAIYLGAVGYPGVPDHISLWDLLLRIRKSFDQYVNIRPITLLDGVTSPLRSEYADIDMLVIRENSEGEYAGAGDRLFQGTKEEVALQTGVFSRKGTERIIRYAFEEARAAGKTVTSISKGNALNYSMVFWDAVFEEVSRDYPEITTYSYLVDAASMFFVTDPARFEVVVTSNLFGDILTDLGAGLTGGLGLAAGANVNPTKEYPSMFEPIHGSAPDIAGEQKANPLAAIWSVSQMLDFFGEEAWGKKVLQAIEKTLTDGDVLTLDMGGTATTAEAGSKVAACLKEIAGK
jgi:tartrate dehydrogenase/decarboxylase / D-malate dehydrogenase